MMTHTNAAATKKTYAVSPETAKRALAALQMFGTPEAAAHQMSVTLTAIRPYTDRATERVMELLHRFSRLNDERRTAWLNALAVIAGRTTDRDGYVMTTRVEGGR